MASNEPPPEKDMKEFEFVQLCKFRVSQPDMTPPSLERCQMLACSSVYSLVIFATKAGFNVVNTSDLLSIDASTGTQRNKVTIEDIPVLASVSLPSPAHFLSLSGDDTCLAVAFEERGQTIVVLFDVHGFADKSSSHQPFGKVPISGVSMVDLSWNPTLYSMLAVCQSDGGMTLVDVKDGPIVIASLPSAVGATSISWSPKGKQLLVGKKDGTLSQYDHALTEKKKWACPTVFVQPQAVVDVLWLSTYSVLAAYLPQESQDSDQPMVVMTNSNKENNSTFINFDDVCFSSSEDRKAQYLFHNIQKWEVVLMASSRATEVTLVGKNLDNKTSWEHWNLEDSCRAELPLTGDQCDSFPLGLAVDYSPHKPVVLSETKTFPACPVMFLLSTDGLLLAYHLHYSHKEAGQITSPPQGLNPGQARKGVPGLLGATTTSSTPNNPSQLPKPNLSPAAAATPTSSLLPTTAAATSTSILASAATQAPTAEGQRNIFNIFGASSQSGSKPAPASGAPMPAASTFQFGKAVDGAASFTSPLQTSSSNQKPGLLSVPSGVNASQSQLGQGQPISSTFSFSFGGGGERDASTKAGQSSAFASIPPSNQSTTPSSTSAGFNFSQTSTPGPSLFSESTTPVSKPSSTPFMAPRQATPPTQQQATPPPGKPASTSPGIFQLKTSDPQQLTPKLDGLTKTTQQTTSSPDLQQQQRPMSSVFGMGASVGIKPGTPLSIINNNNNISNSTVRPAPPLSGVGVVGGHNVNVTKPIGGQQITQVKGPLVPQPTQNAPETGHISSIEATVDGAFSQNIVEEVAHFEEEMKKFRLRSKRQVKAVGTRTEMQSLRKDTEDTANFLGKIKDAVKDQLQEVQEMKSNSLNLSADVEKSRTQLQRNADPHYHSLLQGKALDPASAKQLQDIQLMAQVLEQTLSEVNHNLDWQWEQHLAKRSKQGRLSTPTGDAIYKSIKNNHQIICHQRRNVEKLEEKMSKLRLGSKLDRPSSSSVYSLVAEESPRSSGKEEFSPGTRKPLSLKEAVSQGMTPEKVSRLKDILSQRKVPLVKPKTPATLSNSRIVATPRRPTTSSSSSPSTLRTAPTTTPTNLQRHQYGQTPQPPQQQPQQQQQQQLQPQLKSLFGNSAAYQNTPSGIPTTELRLPKGPLLDPDSSTKSNKPQASIFGGTGGGAARTGLQQGVSFNFSQQQQQQQPPASMRLAAGAPTSFSGVAYFKQPIAAATSQLSPGIPAAAATGLSPSQQQQQQQLPSDLQAATQVLNKHLPALFGVPSPPLQPHQQQQRQQQQQSLLQQPVYEDITPTETDETNEDEDDDEEEDYDEEDGGYEDEDEEEEEEEDFVDIGGGIASASAGGFGMGKSFFPVKTTATDAHSTGGGGNKSFPLSKPASVSVPATTTTVATGFSFGASSSVFGLKMPTSTTASSSTLTGTTSLNRSVGFADLAKDSADVTKPSEKADMGSLQQVLPVTAGEGKGSNLPVSTTSPVLGQVSNMSGQTGTNVGTGSIPPEMTPTTPLSTSSSSSSQLLNSGDGNATAPTGTVTKSPGILKTPPATTASVFGGGNASVSSSIFGGAGISASSSPFGGAGVGVTSTVSGPTPSFFSSASATSTTTSTSLVFGGGGGDGLASTSSTTKSSSIFGNVPSPNPTPSSTQSGSSATTLPSIFSTVTTTAKSTSVFGNGTSTGTSVFGSPSTSTTKPSVFRIAGPSSTMAANTGSTTTATAAASSTSTTSSIFGSPASSSLSSSTDTGKPNLFGSLSTSSSAPSPFGGVNSTTSSTVFGAQTGSTSPFFGGGGSSITQASTSPSIFGKGGSGTSSFSFSTQPSAIPFGSGGGFGSTLTSSIPASSSSSSSVFAFNQPAPTTSSGGSGGDGGGGAASLFGGFGGLGAKPSQEKANTNVFGSMQTFGSPTTQNNLFGNTTSSPFGGSTFGSAGTGESNNAFGGGGAGGSGFSAGSAGVAATGFGVSNTSAATPGAFGSSPAFGSTPSFGGGNSAFGSGAKPGGFGSPSSMFGGGATFGSAATFGNSAGTGGSGGVFGSTAGTGGNSAVSPGFGSFAASSAPSFGQLAQSSSTAFGNVGHSGGPGGGFGGGGIQSSPFGGGSTGGGGAGAFGGTPVFGQSPGGGGGGGGGGGFGSPQAGFGSNQSSGFGSSPAFSSYRG